MAAASGETWEDVLERMVEESGLPAGQKAELQDPVLSPASTPEVLRKILSSCDGETKKRLTELLTGGTVSGKEEPTKLMTKAIDIAEALTNGLIYRHEVSFRRSSDADAPFERAFVGDVSVETGTVVVVDDQAKYLTVSIKDIAARGGLRVYPVDPFKSSEVLKSMEGHQLQSVQAYLRLVLFKEFPQGEEPRMILKGDDTKKRIQEKPWCLWIDEYGIVRLTETKNFETTMTVWQQKKPVVDALKTLLAKEKAPGKKKRGKKK